MIPRKNAKLSGLYHSKKDMGSSRSSIVVLCAAGIQVERLILRLVIHPKIRLMNSGCSAAKYSLTVISAKSFILKDIRNSRDYSGNSFRYFFTDW